MPKGPLVPTRPTPQVQIEQLRGLDRRLVHALRAISKPLEVHGRAGERTCVSFNCAPTMRLAHGVVLRAHSIVVHFLIKTRIFESVKIWLRNRRQWSRFRSQVL